MKTYAIILLVLVVGSVLAMGSVLMQEQHITAGISQRTGEVIFGSQEPITQSYEDLLAQYRTNSELFVECDLDGSIC